MNYLVGLCAILAIICIWALYCLRQMRVANHQKKNNERWDGDFLRQLDAWEHERSAKMAEPIRMAIEFNKVSSQMLNELCEWLEMERAHVLCNALVLYHFTTAKRHEGKEVSIFISDEDGETESVDLA